MTKERRDCSIGTVFGIVIELGYLPIALPKLNIMTVDKLLCPLNGFAIVGAFEWNRIVEMTVSPDDVGAIFRHMPLP
jgi:hypothetical protein